MCYKSYPSQRGVACETNVLHVRIHFYGQGYFICNEVYPCYCALRAQCAHYWGERRASPTLVDKTKICLYIYIFIYLYIYIWYVRIPYIYTSCPICARCNISTLRDQTSRTERLNSGNQRNRNLKTVRKGRRYYQDGG